MVSKLIVEDVSPKCSDDTTFTTAFPEYMEALKAVQFDNNLKLPAMRWAVERQLQHTFPVCHQLICYAKLKVKVEFSFVIKSIVVYCKSP